MKNFKSSMSIMKKSNHSDDTIKKKKSVLFADDIGQELCSIKRYPAIEKSKFDEFDDYVSSWLQLRQKHLYLIKKKMKLFREPNSHDNDKNNITKVSNIKPETNNIKKNLSLPLNYTQNNTINDDTTPYLKNKKIYSNSYKNWIILFDTNSLNFNQNDTVKLTKINVIANHGIPKVCGEITVKNITYEKIVFVRYTFNNWKSYTDRPALFLLHVSQNNIDKFSFYIPLIISGNNSRCVEFAICYQANNKIFWDNNFNQNFKIKYKSHHLQQS